MTAALPHTCSAAVATLKVTFDIHSQTGCGAVAAYCLAAHLWDACCIATCVQRSGANFTGGLLWLSFKGQLDVILCCCGSMPVYETKCCIVMYLQCSAVNRKDACYIPSTKMLQCHCSVSP